VWPFAAITSRQQEFLSAVIAVDAFSNWKEELFNLYNNIQLSKCNARVAVQGGASSDTTYHSNRNSTIMLLFLHRVFLQCKCHASGVSDLMMLLACLRLINSM